MVKIWVFVSLGQNFDCFTRRKYAKLAKYCGKIIEISFFSSKRKVDVFTTKWKWTRKEKLEF